MENKKNAKWYREELYGLLLIAKDNNLVEKSYLEEKINDILYKEGINFHPLIKELIEKAKENKMI